MGRSSAGMVAVGRADGGSRHGRGAEPTAGGWGRAVSPVVAVLCTDLVGSTERLDRLGDDAADELRRVHFALLRAAVADSGGQEIKSLGDGLVVSFASPVEAL